MILCSFLCFTSKFSFKGGFESFSLRNFFSKGALRKILGRLTVRGGSGQSVSLVSGGEGGPKLAKIASADI